MHIRVKKSGSFENNPIWVKNASFNAFTVHILVNFRTKCSIRNSGSREKERWRYRKRAGNRPTSISGKLMTMWELRRQSWSEEAYYITAPFTSRNLGWKNGFREAICETSDPEENNGQHDIKWSWSCFTKVYPSATGWKMYR